MVPGLSASSSSTTPSPISPSSSSQDSVFDVSRYIANPGQERSGSTSGEVRGDPLHESTNTDKKKENQRKKYKERYCMNCLMGFRGWYCLTLLGNMEHQISQKDIGFRLFKKEAARKELNTLCIKEFPRLTSSNSRTLCLYSGNCGTDGVHVHSLQQERVHLSQKLFMEC